MKSCRGVSGLVALALSAAPLVGAAVGCGAPQRKPPAVAREMPLPEPAPAPAARADARRDDWRDDDVPPAPRAHVDTSACAPAGKSVVVVGRDADGRPNRWRYFASRHGHRWMTCEAADANGDGKIDARYFYSPSGRLVLEQRDLDFDGNAEIVADYSQFTPRRPRPVLHAHNEQ
jgi:hypothetical protein